MITKNCYVWSSLCQLTFVILRGSLFKTVLFIYVFCRCLISPSVATTPVPPAVSADTYLYLLDTAKGGTIVGRIQVSGGRNATFTISIPGVSYYANARVAPITVKSSTWRKTTAASSGSTDCEESVSYAYPRNLFCIRFSTGEVLTTNKYELQKPAGNSTFLIDVFVFDNGSPGLNATGRAAIRILPSCATSLRFYSLLNSVCYQKVEKISRANSVTNQFYTFSTFAPSRILVGFDLLLDTLRANNMSLGDSLRFQFLVSGAMSQLQVTRFLIVNPTFERVVKYRLESPLSLDFYTQINIRIVDKNNWNIPGTNNTFVLYFIEKRNYCLEESCIAAFTNWTAVKARSQECLTLTDTFWYISKYTNCLSNLPPVINISPVVKTIPLRFNDVITKIEARDPENTTLFYYITRVTNASKSITHLSEQRSNVTSDCGVAYTYTPPRNLFCIEFNTGIIRAAVNISEKDGDKYTIGIQVNDSGAFSRVSSSSLQLSLKHRCKNSSALYTILSGSSCLLPLSPIPAITNTSSSNSTVFRANMLIYKVLYGSVNASGIVYNSSETQRLIINVKSQTNSGSVVQNKNVTLLLRTSQMIYNVFFDLRADQGNDIKVKVFAERAGKPPVLTLVYKDAIKLYPYWYRNYCDSLQCTSTYLKWKQVTKTLAASGVKDCDQDPRFVEPHYKNCFDAPRVTNAPAKYTQVKNGNRVLLSCDFLSFTLPIVSWSLDGTRVDMAQVRLRRESLASNSFKQSNFSFIATPTKQGHYRCTVRNPYGNTTSEQGLVRLTDILTTRVRLRITNKEFKSTLQNMSSEDYKSFSRELLPMLHTNFGQNKTKRRTQIAIRSVLPGSVNVDVSIFTTGVSSSQDRAAACSSLLNVVKENDFRPFLIDTASSSFVFFDCCPSSRTGLESEKGVFLWPPTSAGTNASVHCLYRLNQKRNKANRTCLYKYGQQASWDKPDTSKCGYKSSVTADLETLSEASINKTNAVQISEDLGNLTSRPENITTRLDIHFAVVTIEKIVRANVTSQQVFENVMGTVSNCMDVNPSIVTSSEVYFDSSTRMLRAIQSQADQVAIGTSNSTNASLTVTTKNVAMVALQFRSPPTNGLLLSAIFDLNKNTTSVIGNQSSYGNSLGQGFLENSLASIFIPYEVFLRAKRSKTRARVTSFYFDNLVYFQHRSAGRTRTSNIINSKVLDASFSELVLTNLSNRVISRFLPINRSLVANSTKCVFWKFADKNRPSHWSSDGCTTASYDGQYYSCSCDHLTHFAVLLDLEGPQKPPISPANERALSYITYIGCGISLCGLLLTILSILLFKKLRKSLPPRILICLCVSLAALLILFVTGIERTSSRVGCHIVAIGIHYFILTTFFWMAVEAYNLYRCFVIVIGSHMSMFLRKMSLIAWGIPVVIVAISAGVSIDDYGNKTNCMVTGLPFYIGIVCPIGVLLVTNFVMFIIVLRGMNRNTVGKDKQMDTLTKARIGIACSVLLGLTWIFGFLAVDALRLPFQYVFTILNSLQGFFIFIFYCARNPDVRREWRNALCKKKTDQTTSGKYVHSTDKTTSKDVKQKAGKDKSSNSTDSTYAEPNIQLKKPVVNGNLVAYSKREYQEICLQLGNELSIETLDKSTFKPQ